jgi:flagellar motor switch protein FliM
MSDVVMQTPTEVEAILGRLRLPLAIAEALKVGQVLPLLELDIGDVSLEASDGSRIANCRLGQSGGMRAVRVEPKPEIAMEEGGHFNAPRMRLPEHTIDDPLDEPMPIQVIDD